MGDERPDPADPDRVAGDGARDGAGDGAREGAGDGAGRGAGDTSQGRAGGEPAPDLLLGGLLDDLEYDTPADVEATFRTGRRIAVGYFVVFLLVTFAVPVMSLVLPWWTGARIAGGMSPAFLMTAVGLYVSFLIVGILAATLADNVEERMLGVHDTGEDEP